MAPLDQKSTTWRRRKMTPPLQPSSSLQIDDTLTLIPGLPNDVGALILSMLPYSHHPRLKQTCKSWRSFLSSQTLIYLRQRRRRRHVSHLLCIFPQDPSLSSPYLFDPDNLAWRPIPPMPCNPNLYGLCNFTSVSLGPHLYVIGGSLFDTRSFPIDRPSPSAAAFRFDFSTSTWAHLSPMISPRGSFACAAVASIGQIIVAGGGSRHTVFGAAGSRMSSVERYDVGRDEWVPMDGLPRCRAGCVGFLVGSGEEKEFWVMGGYGESRTVSGVLPVDEYYKDAVVMDVKRSGGGKWREVGDMWRDGERARLGKIVVIDHDVGEDEDGEEDGGGCPDVFMLDNNEIFRYDMVLNSWQKESSVPKKALGSSSFGFVALGEELYVMSMLRGVDSTETRRTPQHQQKRAGTLLLQIYRPQKKTWRSLFTKPPFHCTLDFNTAVMCTIRL